MARNQILRIYHNNLWAKYKGAIFSVVHATSSRTGLSTSFVQLAETEPERAALTSVDLSYHKYPFRLLFKGSYDDVPWYRLVQAVAVDLLENKADLVILPGYHRVEYWAMLIVCMFLGRKRAVFCDSIGDERGKNYFKEKAKQAFFRRCDGVFCYGSRSRKYVERYVQTHVKIFDKCQAAALPHGYDAAAVMSYYCDHMQHASENPRYIYVGRLAREKGLYDLVEAFGLLKDRIPGARLDMVGAGPEWGALKDYVAERKLQGAISFSGPKKPAEIGPLLMASTALILPSHQEPWGLVVNEALSYGCPVVVSDACGCVPELVLDGVTGYSYAARDIGALSTAMLEVLRLSDDRPKRAQACLDVISMYTPERAAAEILRGCKLLLST